MTCVCTLIFINKTDFLYCAGYFSELTCQGTVRIRQTSSHKAFLRNELTAKSR